MREKSQSQKLSESMYMTFYKRQKYSDESPGLRQRVIQKNNTKKLGVGDKTILYSDYSGSYINIHLC